MFLYLHFVDCHHVLLSTLRHQFGFVPANHSQLSLSILDHLCDWRWSHLLGKKGPQPFWRKKATTIYIFVWYNHFVKKLVKVFGQIFGLVFKYLNTLTGAKINEYQKPKTIRYWKSIIQNMNTTIWSNYLNSIWIPLKMSAICSSTRSLQLSWFWSLTSGT